MESKDAMIYLGSQLQAWENAKLLLLAHAKIITLVILALMAPIASGAMQPQHANLKPKNALVVMLTT
jgi:hypothetical protein